MLFGGPEQSVPFVMRTIEGADCTALAHAAALVIKTWSRMPRETGVPSVLSGVAPAAKNEAPMSPSDEPAPQERRDATTMLPPRRAPWFVALGVGYWSMMDAPAMAFAMRRRGSRFGWGAGVDGLLGPSESFGSGAYRVSRVSGSFALDARLLGTAGRYLYAAVDVGVAGTRATGQGYEESATRYSTSPFVGTGLCGEQHGSTRRLYGHICVNIRRFMRRQFVTVDGLGQRAMPQTDLALFGGMGYRF